MLSQTNGVAYAVFDERIAKVARQFEDFKQAEKVGAVVMADTVDEFATAFDLPVEPLNSTIADIPKGGLDEYGRVFADQALAAPYVDVRVTGTLFQTQRRAECENIGTITQAQWWVFPNLFAGGGAACGVSGKADSGYLSGNGLLAAVLGWRAGNYV